MRSDPIFYAMQTPRQTLVDMTDSSGIALLPDEKTLYFNGFVVAVGMGDVIITLTRNGQPAVTLNASYSVAKTFAASLGGTIQKFEAACDHEIMTVTKISAAMEKISSAAAGSPHAESGEPNE